MKKQLKSLALLGSFGIVGLTGCQETKSRHAPIHPNPNMDFTKVLDPQESMDLNFDAHSKKLGNITWKDGRVMRPPVPGTVARGALKIDKALHTGVNEDGSFVATLPSQYKISKEFLKRGQERYNISCAVCHGVAGYGDGPVKKLSRGTLVPQNLHNYKDLPVGYIYKAIVNGGAANGAMMPKLGWQINVEDRWAISAYVRALQLSQKANTTDVPDSVLDAKGWK